MFASVAVSKPLAFTGDERGQVAVSFALACIPALYLIGVGVDYGRALTVGAQMQTAVDQAVIAAAYLSASERATRINAAIDAALANRGLTISAPVIAEDASAKTLTVSLTAAMPTTIGTLLIPSISVKRSATVQTGSTTSAPTYARACVLALETSGDAIYTNSSAISANCGLYSNSGSANGMDINGTSTVTSTFACVAGNYDKDASATVSPLPKTGCAAMSYPFTSLSAPSGASSSSCDADSKKVESNGELNPGVYCNGLEIKGGVTLSLKEGVYVIKNGQFRIGSSAIVTGSNVLIYMSGSNSTFDWGSSSRVQLKGRADGSQKGVVFWSASANTANHKFGCDNTSYLEGVVYSPSTGVEIGSNGTVNGTADWTAWVVKRLQMGSSSGLSIQTKFSAGATPMPDAVANGGLQYLLASGTTTNNQPYLVR